MGCDSANPSESCEMDEQPVHKVTLAGYYIDKYEVTNARYAACVNAGDCIEPKHPHSATRDAYYGKSEYDNHPVLYVTWSQAEAFCSWAGKRLPTEAEWERAAGGINDSRAYPWGNSDPDVTLLNYAVKVGDTTAVGSYPAGASPDGVMDMAGNVMEWVDDWYAADYYVGDPVVDPTGPATGSYRVMRGGDWINDGTYARIANRHNGAPTLFGNYLGFRCARTGPAPTPTPTATATATPTATSTATATPTATPLPDGVAERLISIHSAQMGCDITNSAVGCPSDELPIHAVELFSYYIDKFEVTNARYAACVAAGACTPPAQTSSFTRSSYYGTTEFADYPVVNVNWAQAVAYCTWTGKRLPTEAEWEIAARSSLDTRPFPWGNTQPTADLANFNSLVGDTTAVGSYPNGVSPYGIFDLAGNVAEWVNDWYAADYYSSAPLLNPQGAVDGEYRVFRGGSFISAPGEISITDRAYGPPTASSHFIGFRCARSLN